MGQGSVDLSASRKPAGERSEHDRGLAICLAVQVPASRQRLIGVTVTKKAGLDRKNEGRC